MKKVFKKFVAISLASAMMTAFVPQAMAKTQSEELEALLNSLGSDDPALAEQFPTGYFEIGTPVISMDEDADNPAVIYVMRHGGTEGEVSVNIKIDDYSAEYGKDYYIKLDDGLFESAVEKNEDSIPLFRRIAEEGGKELPINDENATYDDYVEYYGQERADKIIGELKDYSEKKQEKENEQIFDNSYSAPSDEELELAAQQGTLAESPLKTLNRETTQYSGMPMELSDESADAGMDAEDMALAWNLMSDMLPGTQTQITFEDGEQYKEIYVYSKNNNYSDGKRTFALVLDGSDNGAVGENRASTVTITDDEPDEKAVLSIGKETSDTISEGEPLTVTIERKGASYKAATAVLKAVSDKGNVIEAGTVVFMPYMESQTVDIPLQKLTNEDEFIDITLSNAKGAEIELGEYSVAVGKSGSFELMASHSGTYYDENESPFEFAGWFTRDSFAVDLSTITGVYSSGEDSIAKYDKDKGGYSITGDSGNGHTLNATMYSLSNICMAMLDKVRIRWTADNHTAYDDNHRTIFNIEPGWVDKRVSFVGDFNKGSSGEMDISFTDGSVTKVSGDTDIWLEGHDAKSFAKDIGTTRHGIDVVLGAQETGKTGYLDAVVYDMTYYFKSFGIYMEDAITEGQTDDIPGTVNILERDGNMSVGRAATRYALENIEFAVSLDDSNTTRLARMEVRKPGKNQYEEISSKYYDLAGNRINLDWSFFNKYSDYINWDADSSSKTDYHIILRPVFEPKPISVTLDASSQNGGIKMTNKNTGTAETVNAGEKKTVSALAGETLTFEGYDAQKGYVLTNWNGKMYDPDNTADAGSSAPINDGLLTQEIKTGYYNYTISPVYTADGMIVSLNESNRSDTHHLKDNKTMYTYKDDKIEPGRIMQLEADITDAYASGSNTPAYIAKWTVKTPSHKWYNQSFWGDILYYEPINGENLIDVDYIPYSDAGGISNTYDTTSGQVLNDYGFRGKIVSQKGTILNPPYQDSPAYPVENAVIAYGEFTAQTDANGDFTLYTELNDADDGQRFIHLPAGKKGERFTALVSNHGSPAIYPMTLGESGSIDTTQISYYNSAPYPYKIYTLIGRTNETDKDGAPVFDAKAETATVPMSSSKYGFSVDLKNVTPEQQVDKVVFKIYDKDNNWVKDYVAEADTPGQTVFTYKGNYVQDDEGSWGYMPLIGSMEFTDGAKMYVDIIHEESDAEFSYGLYDTGMTFSFVGELNDIYMPEITTGTTTEFPIIGTITPAFNMGPLSVNAIITGTFMEFTVGINIGLLNKQLLNSNKPANNGGQAADAPEEPVSEVVEASEQLIEEYQNAVNALVDEVNYNPAYANTPEYTERYNELLSQADAYEEALDIVNEYNGIAEPLAPAIEGEAQEIPEVHNAEDMEGENLERVGTGAGNSIKNSIKQQFGHDSWLNNLNRMGNLLKDESESFTQACVNAGAKSGIPLRISVSFGITLRFKWNNTAGDFVFDRALVYGNAGFMISATFYMALPEFPIPLYLGFDISTSLGLYNGITSRPINGTAKYVTMNDLKDEGYTVNNPELIDYMGMVPFNFALELYVGVGVRALLNGEVGGGFLQQLNFAFGNGQTGTGLSSFYAYYSMSIVIFKFKWQFVQKSYPYTLYTLAGMAEEEGAFKLDAMTLDDKTYGNDFAGGSSGGFELMSIPEYEHTRVILDNTPNIDSQIANLGDGRYLLVYTTTDNSRAECNRNAVYFTIYHDGNWDDPKILQDDGTLDVGVRLTELSDKIVISFSSASRQYEKDELFETDSETGEDKAKKNAVLQLLSDLDIYTAVIDKKGVSAENLKSKVQRVTDNSDFKFATQANGKKFMGFGHEPVDAVELGNNKVAVFYDVLDYNYWADNADEISDIQQFMSTPSYLMYRIYDANTDRWLGSDSYFENETAYKNNSENWNGQRLVDISLETEGGEQLHPMAGGSDVIMYKLQDGRQIAVIAYVVDPDNDYSKTTNDKVLCLATLRFEDDNIVTSVPVQLPGVGQIAQPRFVKTVKDGKDYTYLVWTKGEDLMFESVDDLFDAARNEKEGAVFEKTEAQINGKFVDKYEITDDTYKPRIAVMHDDNNHYSSGNGFAVTAGNDGNVYAVWAQAKGSKQVFYISALTLKPNGNGGYDEIWSKPKELDYAELGDNETVREYVQSPSLCVDDDGNLMIAHNAYNVRMVTEKDPDTGRDRAVGQERYDTAFVVTRERAVGSVDVESVELDSEYPTIGGETSAKITVKNNGILPADKVSVTSKIVKADKNGVMTELSGTEKTTELKNLYVGHEETVDYAFTLTEEMAQDAVKNGFKYYILSEANEEGFDNIGNMNYAQIGIGSKIEIEKVASTGFKKRAFTLENNEIGYGDELKQNVYITRYKVENMGNMAASNIEYTYLVENKRLWESEDEYLLSSQNDEELKEKLRTVNNRVLNSDDDAASKYFKIKSDVLSGGEDIPAGSVSDVYIKTAGIPEYLYSDQGLLSYLLAASDDTIIDADDEAVYTDVFENVEKADSASVSIRYGGEAVEEITVNANETKKLSAAIMPFEVAAQNHISWSSSDESVAKVASDGTVTAVSEGSADIKAAFTFNSEEISDTVKVNVLPAVPTPTPTARPSSGGGGGGSSSYAVSTSQKNYNNGSVALSKKNASKGETVTITTSPDEGYEVDTITVTDAKGNLIQLTKAGDNEYSFVMPAGKVSVDVSYKETGTKPSATGKPSDSDWWFTDVPESTWYYEPVKYAFDNGLMSGVSDTEFAPELDITRGMFVTVLHRIDGEPEADGDYSFTDVPENAYYADAVAWGSENGIIAGYSDTEFAPEDKITREQLVAIIYRYAKYKGEEGMVGQWMFLLDFADREDISEYAYEALCWNSVNGLITGFEDNTVRPKANTTRAQAAILERFIERDSSSSDGEEQSFEIAPLVGEPSDYSDKNNWINIPEITKDVDTIYFYPTAYNEVGEDVAPICDIDNENMRAGAVDIYNKQATAFADSTNVFAPYYRQTNINALAGKSAEEFDKIQRGVQRTDMYASLDYYFENYNDGRPFIIAGHSQGAQMIKIALGEYFRAHPEYLERMVAAYPIGYSFTNAWLEENGYKFAEGADDTGVIVSWNTEGPENKGHESSVVLPGALAINPINWKRDDTYAAKEENLGSLVINDKGEQEIVPGLNDAQIDLERGVVICTTSDAFVPMPAIFGPASLHGQDYGLYYANIQENAKTRIDAYLNK